MSVTIESLTCGRCCKFFPSLSLTGSMNSLFPSYSPYTQQISTVSEAILPIRLFPFPPTSVHLQCCNGIRAWSVTEGESCMLNPGFFHYGVGEEGKQMALQMGLRFGELLQEAEKRKI